MRIARIVFFQSIALLSCADIVRGELVIENIRFSEQVNRSGSLPNPQTTFFEFPSSPNHLAFSQTAMIAPSYSTGTYDLDWSGDSAHFQTSIDHHLEGFRGGLISNGSIWFRPAVDSYVSLSGTWTYSHYPAQLGSTAFQMRIRQVGSGSSLWSEFESGGTFELLPPSGVFNLSGSAVLQSGILYSVGYNISTDNFAAPPPGALWLGTGLIDITVNPVPEPAAGALLAPALGLFIARRTRSRARRYVR